MRIVSATLSRPGDGENNADFIGSLVPESGLACWAVADGGSAAQLAVKTIVEAFAANPAISKTILANAIEWAQRKILQLQAAQTPDGSPRASVALLCTGGRSALWAHVGNARVYAFRGGEVIFQTQDHSVSQTLVNAGQISPEDIRGHADRRRLLRYLGQPGMVQPTILEDKFVLEAGDLFLLCADGFWEHITELEMQAEWCKSSSLADWLERMEMRLLKAAPEERDSHSAIALMAEA